MTNTTLRERFRIDKNNSSTVSRLISLAIEKNVIKDFDPDGTTKKFKKYIPYWAWFFIWSGISKKTIKAEKYWWYWIFLFD